MAREAYRAAVKPAGPEPRMTTRYCVFFMDEIPPAEHGRQDSITGARGSLDSPRGGRYGLAMPTAAPVTSPTVETVTAALEELHVTWVVRSCELPSV